MLVTRKVEAVYTIVLDQLFQSDRQPYSIPLCLYCITITVLKPQQVLSGTRLSARLRRLIGFSKSHLNTYGLEHARTGTEFF